MRAFDDLRTPEKRLKSGGWRRSYFRHGLLVDIPVQNGREINECIYCGSREPPLTKEHAVPYGLNGPWTLLKASWEACAKITHRFERDTLRSLWPEIRNALAMQTRRPEKRSETLPLVVQREGGDLEKIQVPRSEYPIYLSTPLFPPPAMFWRSEPVRGVFKNFGIIHVAGPTFMEASKRYRGAKFVGGHTNFSPEDLLERSPKLASALVFVRWDSGPLQIHPSETLSSAGILASVIGWARGMRNP
jgi:hypothetical protein